MPKTGSTAIQNSLFQYKDSTLEYADLGTPNHGLPLITAFKEKPEEFYILRNQGTSPDDAQKISERSIEAINIATSGTKSLIFSAEAILDHMGDIGISELISYMRARFDSVEIIIYIRPLQSLAPSQFQERIKSGLGEFKIPDPDYKKRILPVVDRSEGCKITFREYSRDKLFGNDIVRDFCSLIKISAPTTIIAESNPSMTWEALSKIYLFNKHIAQYLPVRQRTATRNSLRKGLENHGERKFAISDELLNSHILRNADDVNWATKFTGIEVGNYDAEGKEGISCEADLLMYA